MQSFLLGLRWRSESNRYGVTRLLLYGQLISFSSFWNVRIHRVAMKISGKRSFNRIFDHNNFFEWQLEITFNLWFWREVTVYIAVSKHWRNFEQFFGSRCQKTNDKILMRHKSPCKHFSLETLMECNTPAVMLRKQLESRDDSKSVAFFGTFGLSDSRTNKKSFFDWTLYHKGTVFD